MELEILHAQLGGKIRIPDTSSEEGRKEAEKLIQGLIKKGTAIFNRTAKDTYKVLGYDRKRDAIIVQGPTGAPVARAGRKAKMTAVPPRAGG